ncbi:unnamed protein product, partial [Laminaria digitata]
QVRLRAPETWHLPSAAGNLVWYHVPLTVGNLVWYYARSIVWLTPYMACLPPRVGICMPAVVFDLFPVVFLIGEAAPASIPVPNPYRPVLRPAGGPPATAIGRTAAQGATVGTKRGRPKGGKNKDGANKPGRNARTASAEEAVKNTPSMHEYVVTEYQHTIAESQHAIWQRTIDDCQRTISKRA